MEGGEAVDTEAMRRLQSGDDTALNDIMERWKRPLTSYLFRLLGKEHESVDLAQETFVRLYQGRLRYRPTGRFSVWIFTIATNLVRNQHRWKQRHPTVALDLPGLDNDPSPEPSLVDPGSQPDQVSIGRERQLVIQAAIDSLAVDLRVAFLLYEVEDLSYQEIARILNCTTKAVENRLYRARQALRGQLSGLRH